MVRLIRSFALVILAVPLSGPAAEKAKDLDRTGTTQMPGRALSNFDAPFRQESRHIDPTKEGWDTEVVQEQAHEALDQIFALAKEGAKPEAYASLIAKDFSCDELRPELSAVFEDAAFRVFRPSKPKAEKARMVGANGLAKALARLTEPLHGAEVRHKFKLFTVEGEAKAFHTRALFEAVATREGQGFQQNAHWRCAWVKGSGDAPLLQGIEVSNFEESFTNNGRPSLLSDCTVSAFAGEPAWDRHLKYGIDHWRHSLERTVAPNYVTSTGVAVADVNGDGLDDVFLGQAYGLPNRLLLQQPDGTVRDVAPASALDALLPTTSALFLDFDNDGDQDLVTATDTMALVYENGGKANFQPRARLAFHAKIESMVSADYDNDALLDLYLCGHTPNSAEQKDTILGVPLPMYDANNGQPNMLLRNLGGWKFQDVTEQVGLNVNNTRFTNAAGWEDYDNDGDQDLYVANDFGKDCLYRNDGGRFTDVAKQAGVEDPGFGMSVSWADYNQDGKMDVYVANMFSGAGNRITFQPRFRPGTSQEELEKFRYTARGNTLFENKGDGTFRDVTVERDVTLGRWAWSSKFGDLNNDGLDDLLIANGFVSNSNPDDL